MLPFQIRDMLNNRTAFEMVGDPVELFYLLGPITGLRQCH
jgi:hypothetical protein